MDSLVLQLIHLSDDTGNEFVFHHFHMQNAWFGVQTGLCCEENKKGIPVDDYFDRCEKSNKGFCYQDISVLVMSKLLSFWKPNKEFY